MNRLFLVLALAACACLAADPPPSTSGTEVRVVPLKHLRGDKAREMAQSLYNVLNPGGTAIYDANLNALIVRGYPAQLEPVVALVRNADAPQQAQREDPQAQLRIHFVLASPDAGKDGTMSAEISSAIAQMRKAFTFASYRELDTVLVQTRSDGSNLTGTLPFDFARKELVATYNLRIDNSVVGEDEVTLRNFQVDLRIPYETGPNSVNFYNTILRTSVTLKKGQKIVVGKLSSAERKEAIFVVLAADII